MIGANSLVVELDPVRRHGNAFARYHVLVPITFVDVLTVLESHTGMANLQKIIIPIGLIAYLLCGTLAAILPRISEDKRGAYLDLPWGKRSSVFEHIPPEHAIWEEELRPIISQHKRGAYIDLPWGR
ncbi:hypothetical protein CLF_105825 [Clonorchis sinensis]|uniref:Uncharacterized protein n=1 Tax=Clonorchis sinensis TaxID=79923 RepID=G7YE99_CLOSI|nr:hypothetical protein CLF_105825 [Clonorchis sinensis]